LPAKPVSFWDLEPHTPPDPPREPGRRRALHPVALALAAVLAVGVASTVGTFMFGDVSARPAAAVGPDGTDRRAPAAQDALVGNGPPAQAPAVGDSLGATAPSAPAAPASGPAGASPPPPPPPSKPAAPKPTGDATAEGAVLTLVNQERAKAGCQPLTSDSRLATAARQHSQDMADRNYFDHTTPDGVTFDKRITNAGYRWSNAGENIAKGQKDATSVMQAWMNSPGHRANILNCKFKNIGVGLAYDGKHTPYWTQDFGTLL
jgi:uncharacterized protein YkwD